MRYVVQVGLRWRWQWVVVHPSLLFHCSLSLLYLVSLLK
jgi:hypothetical protein